MTNIDIENIIKEKLSSFEYQADNSDWDNFEKKLPKKRISYSKYYFAAASIVVISLLSILFINTKAKNNKIINITHQDNKNTKTIVDTKKHTPIISTKKEENTTKQPVNNMNSTKLTENKVLKNKIDKDTTNTYVKTNNNIIKNDIITDNNITDNYKPIASFTVSANNGCPPLKIIFSADDKNEDTHYIWDFDDGAKSSENQLEHTYTKPGTYTVKLTSYNKHNTKKSSFETEITVYDVPKADFNYSVFENRYLFEGLNYNKQIWKFGDKCFSNEINPEHIYSRIGETTVSFIAINEYGCQSETSKIINIEPVFQIANAFSPNNDGDNDEFGPIFENPEQYNYFLYIYNAYGDLIFKSMQANQNWNGKLSNSNNIANKEIYLWKLIITDKDKHEISKKGKLTIK